MTSSSSPNSNSNPTYDGSSSYFEKTVVLYDWWLTKAEDESGVQRLAVAGFTSRGKQPKRVFTSGPIAKRHDVFSLKTADGVYVIIQGFINKSRTTENGFSYNVFDHFVFGFPPDWEKLVNEIILKEQQHVDDVETSIENASKGSTVNDPDICVPDNVSEEKGFNPGSSPCKNKEVNNSAGPVEKDSEVFDSIIGNKNIENIPTPVENGCQAASVIDKAVISESQYAPPSTTEISAEDTEGQKSTQQSKEQSTPFVTENNANHQSGTQTSESSPPMVSNDTQNESPNTLGSRIINSCLKNLSDDAQKEKQSATKNENKGSAVDTFEFPDSEQIHESSFGEAIIVDKIQSPSEKCSSGKTRKQKKTKSPTRQSRMKKKEPVAVKTGDSSRTKSKRKINFDAQETPRKQEKKKRKASAISPESSTFKRSRSGRKLLPALEFWRNQIPVYNADHGLTDIQEGLDAGKKVKGFKVVDGFIVVCSSSRNLFAKVSYLQFTIGRITKFTPCLQGTSGEKKERRLVDGFSAVNMKS
ncbi:hypothetical protein ACFE04_002816 [Oxalis oulophora]